MKKIINILHLEDSTEDAALIHETINSEITFCRIQRVDNQEDFQKALTNKKFDLIISDFALPSFNGLEALRIAKDLAPDIPYIYVSGHIGEDRAIEALKNGATDYVLKDKPAKLVPAILRALKESEEREKLKIAESALKESERFAISTVNAMSVQIAILNENGIILEANKSWKNNSVKNSCVPQGVLPNENYLEQCRHLNKPDSIKFATGIMSVINNYEKEYIQEYNCTGEENTKWFQGRVNKFEGEGPVRIVVLHVDVTEQRTMTEQLKESEKRYRLITENSTDLIATTNENGIFTYVSPVSDKLLGYKSEEMQNHSIFEFLHSDDQENIKSKRKNFLDKEDSYYINYRVKKKDGSYTWFESASKKLINKKTGRIETIISVSRDISRRKKGELELLQAKEKAEEMNRLKSSFLANMSHELRTPLIGILGFSQILSSELTSEEHKDMADTIYNSGNRLLSTLNLILDLSRIEADKLEIMNVLFDGIECVKEILKLLKNAADKKGLLLNLDSTRDTFKLRTDRRLFTAIIESVVDNAIKFTKKGCVIVQVEEEIKNANSLIVIKVIDTGIGIAKESQEIIFDEFRQVSEGYGRNFEGIGLGLTITKRFVDKLNGSISVESEIGKGTTLIIKLPAYIGNETN